jgi:hypothetical protein
VVDSTVVRRTVTDFLLALSLAIWVAVIVTAAKLDLPVLVVAGSVSAAMWVALQKNLVAGSRPGSRALQKNASSRIRLAKAIRLVDNDTIDPANLNRYLITG